MVGTYKFYIGRCNDCDKEDYYPIYNHQNKDTTECGFCGGEVYIDKSETFKSQNNVHN